MMDNLLAKLRSGEAETTLKARRRARRQSGSGTPVSEDADVLAENLLKSLQSPSPEEEQ